MAKATIVPIDPTPVPQAKVVLELDAHEATVLFAVAGTAVDLPWIHSALGKALNRPTSVGRAVVDQSVTLQPDYKHNQDYQDEIARIRNELGVT